MNGAVDVSLLDRLKARGLPFVIDAHCLHADLEDDGPMLCCIRGDVAGQLEQMAKLHEILNSDLGKSTGLDYLDAFPVGDIAFDGFDETDGQVRLRVDRDGEFQFHYQTLGGIRHGTRTQDMTSTDTPFDLADDGRLMLVGEGIVGDEVLTESAVDSFCGEA